MYYTVHMASKCIHNHMLTCQIGSILCVSLGYMGRPIHRSSLRKHPSVPPACEGNPPTSPLRITTNALLGGSEVRVRSGPGPSGPGDVLSRDDVLSLAEGDILVVHSLRLAHLFH
jgi:hypothetical protein